MPPAAAAACFGSSSEGRNRRRPDGSNRRGHGRFTRNVVGRLVERTRDATYVVYVDKQSDAAARAPRQCRASDWWRCLPPVGRGRISPREFAISCGMISPYRETGRTSSCSRRSTRTSPCRHADRRRRARHDRGGLPGAHAADSARTDVLVGKAEACAASCSEAVHGLRSCTRGRSSSALACSRRIASRWSPRRRMRSSRRGDAGDVEPALAPLGSSGGLVLHLCRRHQPAQESRDAARGLRRSCGAQRVRRSCS